MILLILVVNALLGLVLLEWAWSCTAKLRVVDEARDSQYPSRRRQDLGKVSKLILYPCDVTILVPRFLAFIAIVIGSYIFCK